MQVRIKRAFAAAGAPVLTSSEIYSWTHPRRRLGRKTMPLGIYSRTLRTLDQIADRIGRGTSIGRPWLWRLRNGNDGARS